MANIRNGAKGTSDPMPIFSNGLAEILPLRMSAIPHIAPIQKAKITAETPDTKPSNAPIPKTNLASPKPIHFPFETSHKRANGVNKINGEAKSNQSLVLATTSRESAYLQYEKRTNLKIERKIKV